MTAFTLPRELLIRLRAPAALRRGLIAGVTWGLSLTVALTALAAWQCGGVICIDETLWLAGALTAIGIVAIGPIATVGVRAGA